MFHASSRAHGHCHGPDAHRRRFHRGRPGHGHHGQDHASRGGRGGRFLDGGDLRLIVLRLIAERSRHGYELIKAMEERTGGGYAPSPGVIYPTLTLLEEIGQIAAVPPKAGAPGGRKLYAITPEGEAALAASRARTDALMARLDEAGVERPRGGSLRLLRAMHNLRTALRLRAARGDLDEDALARIVALLDDTARRVETE